MSNMKLLLTLFMYLQAMFNHHYLPQQFFATICQHFLNEDRNRKMPEYVLPSAISLTAQRMTSIATSIPEFNNMSQKLKFQVLRKNLFKGAQLFCMKMESQRTAFDQLFTICKGLGDKEAWNQEMRYRCISFSKLIHPFI